MVQLTSARRAMLIGARSPQLVAVAVLLAALAGGGASSATAQRSRPQPIAAQPTQTAVGGAAAATATAAPNLSTSGLVVQGTTFYYRGRAVTLVGANHSSLEYSCGGDGHFTTADFQALRAWGANAVRIPLSSEFWANADDDCPGYHDTVIKAVDTARAAGLFVILDLQWSAPFDTAEDRTKGGVQCPMPDASNDVAFWQDMALLFHTDTGVLFDLYGEPYDVSWSTWLNGGTITEGCYIIDSPPRQEFGTYQAIGMQALTDKVRAIAPDNVIVLGGLGWGYDLSGVGQGYAVKASNVVYDTHPYDYSGKQPANWPADFGGVAQRFPVIAGEFGGGDCTTGYIGAAIDFFNAHQMSWLAWNWGPGSCSGGNLIADWSGAPSPGYGSYIKQRMAAVAQPTG